MKSPRFPEVLACTFLALPLYAHAQEPVQDKSAPAPSADLRTIAAAKAELEAMWATDQSHRSEVTELEKKHGRNSPEVKEAWSKQNAIDAQNIQRLEEIIAQHGWPGSTEFGSKAAGAAFLILQHADISHQKKHLPAVRAAAAKGEMRPSSLALLEDRVRLREGQKQVYGSQVTRNAAGEWEPLPLEDEENVDALRATVGLGPIGEYLQGFASRSEGRVSPKWAKKRAEAPSQAAEAVRVKKS